MAFDKNKFKQNIKNEEESKTSKINEFIDEFTEKVESEEFEDWLQEQLEYTNKQYNELMFYMGIDYRDKPTRFHFCISGNDCFSNDNIVFIKFGHEFIALDKYEKEQDEYLDAMSECWKILKQKLKSLGLMITTSEPHWEIEYIKYNSRKIELELIDED